MKYLFIALIMIIVIMDTLLLKPECAELLRKLKKNSDETVICIFDNHIQFEKLDEMELLPRDLMHIIHEYFDNKMIVECKYCSDNCGKLLKFDINDNDNKIVYYWDLHFEMLCVYQNNFDQMDDSISIIPSSAIYFANLSRFYYYYCKSNNLFFRTNYNNGNATMNNNEYNFVSGRLKYSVIIRNHEILKRRIDIMKQLIDIIGKK